ncbi:tryptophan halogenase family protein [Paraglaciecola aquimarina]|uniref:Tryptophan halogenase family protein n=1 Tax=Paraglaciecola aquimarina TaxID=1235557 RepID=A0ABU3SYR3_9ALTE|nr:tryptophan halogenase family protein [Paraglaciecola aquimarina]MDU0355112.1 tryptophan halogenase family protein [Paraglaciecola aquimarina]
MTNITIVGGGTAGWITAAVLSHGLPKERFKITLIESPNIRSVGVGEATIPPIVNLLQFLNIDPIDFVQSLQATFKYGIQFEDWSELNTSYMHAFGDLGFPYEQTPFSDLWLHYRQSLNLSPLNDFSATAIAASKHAFNPPHTLPPNANPNDYYPLSTLFYAYHFDSQSLANYLTNIALKNGVHHIKDTVDDVKLNQQQHIASLTLQSGRSIEGEIFIDCSGFKGLLSKQVYQLPFTSYQRQLPCDSAIAIQTKSTVDATPFTRAIAMKNGWRWQIPLQNRRGNGYVFASQFCKYQQALDELEQALLNDTIITEARLLEFETGHLTTPWYRNCVAIGLSSGFFEPLESTSIHLIQKHVFALKDALLSNNQQIQQKQLEFNHSFNQDAEEIRDFLLMHYCTTKRQDSQFWQYCQNMPIPASLSAKLSEYDLTGKITLGENPIFPYQSWLQVLTGQQVFPTTLTRLDKARCSAQQASLFFQSVNQSILQQVNSLPSHRNYLANLMRL